MKGKYKFHADTLRYVEIKVSFKEKLLKFLTYFMAIFVAALILNVVFSFFFDTPKEKQQKRENRLLAQQIERMDNQLDVVEKVLKDIQQRDDNIYRTIFEAEPIPNSVRQAGIGGVNRYKELEELPNSEIVIRTAQRLDKTTKQLYIQSVSYDEIIKLAKSKEDMIACVPAIMPISNKDLTRTASGWGYRIHPIYKIRKFHYGMDFTAPSGAEIYASGDGVIETIQYSARGYGNMIIINHGYGYKSLYAHMKGFNVNKGDKVKRGDVIGYVGSTGLSTAPHLHYEILKNGKRVNPINYYFNDLTAIEYDKMIEISAKSGQSFD